MEIYSCSLCSFTEIGLDRLVAHVRQHIKPEPSTRSVISKKHIKEYMSESSNVSDSIEILNARTISREELNNYNARPVTSEKNHFSNPPLQLLEKSAEIFTHPICRRSSGVVNGQKNFIRPVFACPDVAKPVESVGNSSYFPMQQLHRSIPVQPIEPLVRVSSNNNYDVGHSLSINSASEKLDPLRFHITDSFTVNSEYTAVTSTSARNRTQALSPQNKSDSSNLEAISNSLSDENQTHINRPFKDGEVSNTHVNISNKNVNLLNETSVILPNTGGLIQNTGLTLESICNLSLNQLSGLLIVPLKKTHEVGVQTEPIDQIAPLFKTLKSSSLVQTDLKMGQINECVNKPITNLLDSIRSTDDLFECLVCGDQLPSEASLQIHMSQYHSFVCEICDHISLDANDHVIHLNLCGKIESGLQCVDCNQLFTSIKNLHQHRVKTHYIRMPFVCAVCHTPFESHHAVMEHLSVHEDNAPQFKCRSCVKVFQTTDALSKHYVRHKSVQVVHECRICRKQFNSSDLLQVHINDKHVINNNAETDLQTTLCERPFSTSKNVSYVNDPSRIMSCAESSSSERVHNTPKSENHSTKISNDQALQCQIFHLCRCCNLAFKSREYLNDHVKICTSNHDNIMSDFICDVCNEFFPSDEMCNKHKHEHHIRSKGFRCIKCSRIYSSWKRLKAHTEKQHLRKTCSECGKIYTKDHLLRQHEHETHGKVASQPKRRCTSCEKSFYTITALLKHRSSAHPSTNNLNADVEISHVSITNSEKSIDNTKDFKCAKCDLVFNTETGLGLHVRQKHFNIDKTHKCKNCNATYNDIRRLKLHLTLKHGEKPYECTECGKRFSYSSQLALHGRTYRHQSLIKKSKSKSLKVNAGVNMCFCGRTFRNEKMLRNHKGAVHKMKLFECPICQLRFSHSTDVIYHLRSCRKPKHEKTAVNENAITPKITKNLTRSFTRRFKKFSDLNDVERLTESETSVTDSVFHPFTEIEQSNSVPLLPKVSKVGAPTYKTKRIYQFKCTECHLNFKTNKRLKLHIFRKHKHKHDIKNEVHGLKKVSTPPVHQISIQTKCTKEMHKCDKCSRVFDTLRQYLAHQKVHVTNGNSLPIQNNTTVLSTAINPTTDNNRKRRKVSLPESDNQSKPQSDNQSKPQSVKCPKCERLFGSKRAVITHVRYAHQIRKDGYNDLWPNGIPNCPSSVIECPICKNSFDSLGISNHVNRTHGLRYADLIKKNGDDLVKATIVASESNSLRVVEGNDGPPVCFICSRYFDSRQAMVSHELKSHGIRWDGNNRILPQRVRNLPKIFSPRKKIKTEPRSGVSSNNL